LILTVYILFEVKVGKIKQAAIVLAAVFSLLTSAVAACGCSHHRIAAAAPAETSCHGAAHEASHRSNDVDQPASGSQIETGCNCFSRESSPSLSSKARISTDSSNETAVEQPVFELDSKPLAGSVRAASYFPTTATDYNSRKGTRAPARGPPRL